MNELNCDIRHVVQGLEKYRENLEEYDRLHVWDTDVIMRGISYGEMKSRNLIDYIESVATIERVAMDCFELKFHESQVENAFEWNGASDNTTKPKELGGNLRMLVMELENEYNEILWDFAEMSAASVGHGGHFCDFEFEYEFILN